MGLFGYIILFFPIVMFERSSIKSDLLVEHLLVLFPLVLIFLPLHENTCHGSNLVGASGPVAFFGVPSYYDYAAMTAEQQLLVVTRWHDWYTADWDYAPTTGAFFCAFISASALVNVFARFRARASITATRKPAPSLVRVDKLTAMFRYTDARQFHFRPANWYAPPPPRRRDRRREDVDLPDGYVFFLPVYLLHYFRRDLHRAHLGRPGREDEGRRSTCRHVELIVAIPDSETYSWMEPTVAAAPEQFPDAALGIRLHHTRAEDTKGSNPSVDIQHGRPILADIVREAHASAGKVVIVACGPDGFLYDVRNAVADAQLVIADGFGSCKDLFLHTETYRTWPPFYIQRGESAHSYATTHIFPKSSPPNSQTLTTMISTTQTPVSPNNCGNSNCSCGANCGCKAGECKC
ncbi:hypothetical protein DFH07DRAFT_942748 [Mycena maculata]|uniref:Uncharacterized protein n=1 Tax=Mycena maculata TaxID=230809 RepID=A0AAD7N4U2_9AGAR|nr:hypothetical protein DFH07DRAFT_942748 [Mycena maculata]